MIPDIRFLYVHLVSDAAHDHSQSITFRTIPMDS